MQSEESGYQTDPRSTEELIRIALEKHENLPECVSLVERLQYRGTSEVFDAAVHLAKSQGIHERILAASVLAGVGANRYAFIKESIDLLIPLLNDDNPEVVEVAAYALGHRAMSTHADARYATKAVPNLLAVKGHSDMDVRRAVAYALGSIQWWHLTPELYGAMVTAVIDLSYDTDKEVRAEAMQAMLAMEHDNDQIVDALCRGVHDESPEVRAAALEALAMKQHPSIVDMLIDELSSSDVIPDDLLQAAADVADARLLPALLELKEDGISGQLIEEAIEECSGNKHD